MYHGLSPLQPVETLIAQLVREVRARVWRLLLLLFFFSCTAARLTQL